MITGNPNQALDPTKTTAIICKCGNFTFVHAAFLRHVSALVSPTGKEGIVPMPTLVCNACGAVPDEAVPQFLKDEMAAKTTDASTKPASHLSLVP